MEQRGAKRQRANPLSSNDQSLSLYEDKLWLWSLRYANPMAYLLEEYPTETDWYSSQTMFSSFRMRKIACFPNAERPCWSILFSQYRPVHTLFFLCLPEKHISLQGNDSPPLTVSLLRKQAFPSAAVQGNPPSPMRQTPVTLHAVINRSQSKHNLTLPLVMSAFHYKELQRSGSLFSMPHLSSSSELDLKPEVLVYRVFRKRKNSTWFCSSLFPTLPPAIITLATRKHYLCHLQFTKETWTQAKKERRKPKNPEVGGNGNKQFWTRMIWRWQLAYVRPKLLQSVKQSDIKLIFIGFHCRLKIH